MSRDIVRPVVVLTLICVIAAASVVGTEALTTPLIAERKATEEVETMRRLMPAADHFETDEQDGKKIYRAFDGDKLAGAAIIVEEGGYHDVVRIAVAVGVTGKVMGVSILQQDETPGLGSRITDGGFLAQFTGKSSADAVRVGADVQAIAGATISSSALARGVRSALETYRVAIAGEMAPGGVDIAGLPDGIYRGSAEGFHGLIVVDVEIEDGRITQVAIVEQTETPSVSQPAREQVPGRIVQAQSPDVDVIAGATVTSRGIIGAVNDALANAQE